MNTPVLLDLFCGGGGAAAGYEYAGFKVIGVDVERQDSYPYEMFQGDALAMAAGFVAMLRPSFIHASPPCQASSPTEAFRRRRTMRNPTTPEPVNLIPETRDRLDQLGIPWVMENVAYARTGLRRDLMLCGEMFGLDVYRHRWFEFGRGAPVPRQPEHHRHHGLAMRNGYLPTDERPMMTVTGRNSHHSKAWVARAALAMGTPWLSRDLNAVCEAIPPSYTKYIGDTFMSDLNVRTPARSD